MREKIEIITNTKLEYYDHMLSIFPEWKSINREIKLTTLLEGKKIKFDIEEIITNKKILGILYDDIEISTHNAIPCFTVESMSFILMNNIIEKITLDIKILDNEKGNLVKNLMKSNIIEIKEYILDDNVLFFYVSYLK